jgi:hypothetical protein
MSASLLSTPDICIPWLQPLDSATCEMLRDESPDDRKLLLETPLQIAITLHWRLLHPNIQVPTGYTTYKVPDRFVSNTAMNRIFSDDSTSDHSAVLDRLNDEWRRCVFSVCTIFSQCYPLPVRAHDESSPPSLDCPQSQQQLPSYSPQTPYVHQSKDYCLLTCCSWMLLLNRRATTIHMRRPSQAWLATRQVRCPTLTRRRSRNLFEGRYAKPC